MIGADATTMPAGSFIDDSGALITEFPALAATDYVNVYINGMLQQASLFTLSTTDLVLDAIDVPVGVPVLIEIGSFAGTSSTITAQPTISAPTITIIS